MSGKTHNPPGSVPNSADAAGGGAWALLKWLAPLWVLLAAAVGLIPAFSMTALDDLARGDTNPEIRTRLDGLRPVRGLLQPPGTAAGAQIWQGRAAPGFFLAGAVEAERRGRPEAARLWLALNLLERGDKARARRLLAQSPGAPALPESLDPRNPATWGQDLYRRLEESLK